MRYLISKPSCLSQSSWLSPRSNRTSTNSLDLFQHPDDLKLLRGRHYNLFHSLQDDLPSQSSEKSRSSLRSQLSWNCSLLLNRWSTEDMFKKSQKHSRRFSTLLRTSDDSCCLERRSGRRRWSTRRWEKRKTKRRRKLRRRKSVIGSESRERSSLNETCRGSRESENWSKCTKTMKSSERGKKSSRRTESKKRRNVRREARNELPLLPRKSTMLWLLLKRTKEIKSRNNEI